MSDMDELEQTLDATIQNAIRRAYEIGFNDGLGVKIPNQDEFNGDHREVVSYGDEAEYLVLSSEYTEETAHYLFKKYLEEECGIDEEYMGVTLDTLAIKEIGYRLPEGETEPVYWINSRHNGLFRAWVINAG